MKWSNVLKPMDWKGKCILTGSKISSSSIIRSLAKDVFVWKQGLRCPNHSTNFNRQARIQWSFQSTFSNKYLNKSLLIFNNRWDLSISSACVPCLGFPAHIHLDPVQKLIPLSPGLPTALHRGILCSGPAVRMEPSPQWGWVQWIAVG